MDIVNFNTAKICRACLTEGENMESLLEDKTLEMFNSCTSLCLKTDDSFPLTICFRCKSELVNAYAFKQLCIKSQNTLRNIADCHLNIDEQQFSLLDYLKTDGTIQPVELILENQVEMVADDAINIEQTNVGDNKGKFKCEVCLDSFDLECDLETHMIAHPENDDTTCTLCQKQFKDLKVLRRHVRIHLKKKPYEVCYVVFNFLRIFCFNIV